MEKLELSGELLSRLAGKKLDELKDLLHTEAGELKENAAEIFVNTVITKFSDSEKEAKEQQFNRGIREKGKAIEAALKPLFDDHKISDFKTAEEGITKLAEKLKEVPPTGDPSTLTIEELRKLPTYQEALNQDIAAKDEKIQEVQSAFDSYKSEIETREFKTDLKKQALSVLEKSGARFSGDTQEAIADDIDFHLRSWGIDQFKRTENGSFIPVDGDGNQLRDSDKNLLSFESFAKSNWKLGFDTVPKDKSFSAAGKKGGAGSGSGIKITSEEDYTQKLAMAKDNDERSKIQMAFAEFVESKE